MNSLVRLNIWASHNTLQSLHFIDDLLSYGWPTDQAGLQVSNGHPDLVGVIVFHCLSDRRTGDCVAYQKDRILSASGSRLGPWIMPADLHTGMRQGDVRSD